MPTRCSPGENGHELCMELQRTIHRAAAILAILIAFVSYDRVPAPSLDGQKVIFLGPGGGHVAYTMGFIGTLLRDQRLRTEILKSGAVFGGTSSGAVTAAYATAVLNGVGTMRSWWSDDVRRGFEIALNQSTLGMGAELSAGVHRYYETCQNATTLTANTMAPATIPWLQRFPVSVTEAWPPLMRPRFFTEFKTSDEFCKVLTATSYVPGLMGLQPILPLSDGSPSFDGFIGSWRVVWPDNYLFVSFLPTIPNGLLGKHHLPAYEYDSLGGGVVALFLKAWPWADPPWFDQAFQRGETDARTNLQELREQICNFLMT